MKKPNSPCLHCGIRSINCHDNCKEYIKYKAEFEMYSKALKENIEKEVSIKRYKTDTIMGLKRRANTR